MCYRRCELQVRATRRPGAARAGEGSLAVRLMASRCGKMDGQRRQLRGERRPRSRGRVIGANRSGKRTVGAGAGHAAFESSTTRLACRTLVILGRVSTRPWADRRCRQTRARRAEAPLIGALACDPGRADVAVEIADAESWARRGQKRCSAVSRDWHVNLLGAGGVGPAQCAQLAGDSVDQAFRPGFCRPWNALTVGFRGGRRASALTCSAAYRETRGLEAKQTSKPEGQPPVHHRHVGASRVEHHRAPSLTAACGSGALQGPGQERAEHAPGELCPFGRG